MGVTVTWLKVYVMDGGHWKYLTIVCVTGSGAAMQFYVSRLLLMVTRAALKVSGVLFWILVYVASLLAAASYLPDALRLVARGPFRAFRWEPRKAAPACLTSSKHGQHGNIRIKVRTCVMIL